MELTKVKRIPSAIIGLAAVGRAWVVTGVGQ
jgi:hypothetical protein